MYVDIPFPVLLNSQWHLDPSLDLTPIGRRTTAMNMNQSVDINDHTIVFTPIFTVMLPITLVMILLIIYECM